MTYREELIERITVDEFCKRYGVEVVVRERAHVPEGTVGRYYAYLNRTEIEDRGMLISPFSDGVTITEALSGIPVLYSNHNLSVDAHTDEPQCAGPFVFVPEEPK